MINNADAPFFSGLPQRKLIASSPPICVFRNREGYRLDGNNAAFEARARTDHVRALDRQTRLCSDALAGAAGIPTRLLYGTLRHDMLETAVHDLSLTYASCLKYNTVAVFQHNYENLFLHAAGHHRDELILRHADHMWCFHKSGRDTADTVLPHDPPSNGSFNNFNWLPGRWIEDLEAGFTLPVSSGRPIINVAALGSSFYNGNSTQLLVRTSNEIVSLKTTSVVDHFSEGAKEGLARKKSVTKATLQLSEYSLGTILEPLQKWRFPESIADMCTSSALSPYVGASFITESGCVLRWCPTLGIYSHSNQSVLPPDVMIPNCAGFGSPKSGVRSALADVNTLCDENTSASSTGESGAETEDTTDTSVVDETDTNYNRKKSMNSFSLRPQRDAYHNIMRTGMTSARQRRGLEAASNNLRLRLEASVHPQVNYVAVRDQLLQLDYRCPTKETTKLIHSAAPVHAVQQLHHPHYFVVATGNAAIYLMDHRYTAQAVSQRMLLTHHNELLSSVTSNSACDRFLSYSRASTQVFVHDVEIPQTQNGNASVQTAVKTVAAKFASNLNILNSSRAFSRSGNIPWDYDGFPVVDSVPHADRMDPIVSLCGLRLSHGNSEDQSLLIQQNSLGDVFVQRLQEVSNPYVVTKASKSCSASEYDIRTIPPVQQYAPSGLRCFPTTPSKVELPKFQTQRLSKKREIGCPEEGLTPHHLVTAGDMQIGDYHSNKTHKSTDICRTAALYPASSSTFHKIVPEDSLKSFDVLHLYPEDLRLDIPFHKRSLRSDVYYPHRPAPTRLRNHWQLMDSMIKHELISESVASSLAATYCASTTLIKLLKESQLCTLWEIQKIVAKHCNVRFDVQILRHCLRKLENATELIVVCANSLGRGQQMMLEDGIVRTPGSIAFSYKQRVSMSSNSMQRKRKIVGLPPDDINVASRDAEERSVMSRCGCDLNLSAASSPSDLKICTFENCVIPHLLTYDFDQSIFIGNIVKDSTRSRKNFSSQQRVESDSLSSEVIQQLQSEWAWNWDRLPPVQDITKRSTASIHFAINDATMCALPTKEETDARNN